MIVQSWRQDRGATAPLVVYKSLSTARGATAPLRRRTSRDILDPTTCNTEKATPCMGRLPERATPLGDARKLLSVSFARC